MAMIVVGIDGSSESTAALRWAVGEAARRQATVRAVAAYDYLIADVLGAPVQVHPIAGDPARAFEHAVAAVDAVKSDLPPGVTVEPEAVEGEPGRVLCELAVGADLLVVSRHGSRGRRHHLGSVASYVVHHSPVPVVVLPPGTD